MDRSAPEFRVTLFLLAGAAALLVLAFRVSNVSSSSLSNSYRLYAEFDNIGALKLGAPVKSAGVVVGRVERITFDNETYRAKVEMDIDDKYKFPIDTSASILTSGLLGEQYVGLEAGADEATLKNNDTMELTQSAINVEELIGQFLNSRRANVSRR